MASACGAPAASFDRNGRERPEVPMVTANQLAMLILIGVIGHAMALVWYIADKRKIRLCRDRIYDMPIGDKQIRREIANSIHTPIHAVLLYLCLLLGFFQNTTWLSFFASLALTFVWAEIWHYVSHRLFHIPQLHWIHAEHHRSRLNSPFTAISFSFTEKLVFDAGILGALALVDLALSLNFYGIAAWYVGYLVINSFSHANCEIKSRNFHKLSGRVLTSATYHALHHSRYTGNYGLGTRFMDRLFGTEWEDYVPLYEQIKGARKPLTRLTERAEARDHV
jgi:Delta7-sterol 5-desaturase